jgi:hypothetical protein
LPQRRHGHSNSWLRTVRAAAGGLSRDCRPRQCGSADLRGQFSRADVRLKVAVGRVHEVGRASTSCTRPNVVPVLGSAVSRDEHGVWVRMPAASGGTGPQTPKALQDVTWARSPTGSQGVALLIHRSTSIPATTIACPVTAEPARLGAVAGLTQRGHGPRTPTPRWPGTAQPQQGPRRRGSRWGADS